MESLTVLKACTILVEVFYTMTVAVIPQSISTETDDFIAINNSNSCVCKGYNLVYECRVTGSSITIWKGAVFDCTTSSNELVLLHGNSGIDVECNGGAITGRIIRAENNTYVSQLTVSVSAEMNGMNISCHHDGTTENLIGSSLLILTTDPYQSPHDIYLMVPSADRLVFKWSSVTPSCEAVHYLVNASNCGHCPNVTNDTTVICTDFTLGTPLYDQECLLSVRTVVCDNITGNESSSVQVDLRVPDSPVVNVIPTYSYSSKTLLRLTARFNETETFNIADGVDGSAISYTINYTDSSSGVICKTEVISVTTFCVNGSCEHDSESSPSICFSSTGISVIVSGTNVLGNGAASNPVIIPGRSDHFVDVTVNLASEIVTCLFLQQTENCEKYCSIEYAPSRENCKPQNWRKFTTNATTSGNVVRLFPSLNNSEQFQPEEYCFTVTASNGTFTVLIEGTTTVSDTQQPTDGRPMLGTVTAIAAVFAVIIVITLLGLIITLLSMIVKKIKTVYNGETQFANQITAHIRPTNNEVDTQDVNKPNKEGIGIYSLLQPVGDEPPESQTTPIDPVYVEIGPSTTITSQENFLLPLYDDPHDKVEYTEVKQTAEDRKVNTDSMPALLDKHLDLDNLLIQLQDDITPHWYEFGVVVGVPKEILDKCKDYPPDQCIVEVLDYWLMHHRGQLTWRDVAHAVNEINIHHLADYT